MKRKSNFLYWFYAVLFVASFWTNIASAQITKKPIPELLAVQYEHFSLNGTPPTTQPTTQPATPTTTTPPTPATVTIHKPEAWKFYQRRATDNKQAINNSSHIFAGPDLTDLLTDDTQHLKTNAKAQIWGQLWWTAVKNYLSGAGGSVTVNLKAGVL